MLVRRVDIWHLKLKFLSTISHNLATHEGSENIVVKVTTDGGVAGYGEGIPRSFVTGEQLPDSLTYLEKVLAPAVLELDLNPVQAVPETLAGLHRDLLAVKHPGAFCAAEMALLDAAGHTWDRPVGDFIGPRLRNQVTYSAVVPMASERQVANFFKLVKMNRMEFLKLKVGTQSDLQILKMARHQLGWKIDIRVDANGAWSAPEAIERLREMAPYQISAVEQPVAKEDFEGMRTVSAALDLPVIADESLCHEGDARRLIEMQACRIFNLRLSKCGGLGAAAGIQRLAKEAGVACQLGCHVGETSILSAAGRNFALCFPDLVHVEGSFAPFILEKDLVREPVSFGYAGLAHGLEGPGLGLAVLDSALKDLAVSHLELER